MGRLFWKFFAFIWLAQLVGIVAIGSAFWFTARRADQNLEMAYGPGAGTRVEAASDILKYAGVEGFKSWSQHERREIVFAVDESGRELLERALAPGLIQSARQLHQEDPWSPIVSEVGTNGHRYLLFAAAPDMAAAPGDPRGPPRGLGPPRPEDTRLGGPRALPPPSITLTTLIASLLTAVLLAWYVAKPIRSLRFAFDGVAGGNLSQRVMPLIGKRQDELADLGRDFDRMAERLQASMEGQRRLLHDVSHEVRSPLARLQAAVGLLRRKYDREEPTIERIEEEIVRIDRLVGDLLNLSRIEAGELAGAEEEIQLLELLTDVVADANFEAASSGRSITWNERGAASLIGRADMLRVAIENVVRNALKHAPESRDITIRTSVDAARSTYTIRVLDSGPGVPDEELAQMFTPFFRSTHAEGTDGYGLGLAIAKRSLEAHGGRIFASNRPEGGLVVTIELPLPRTPVPSAG